MILGLIAQNAVRSKFAKYSQERTRRGLTGAQVARQLLDNYGLHDVRIEEAQGGDLSDHYDPSERILRLSPGVGRELSIAAAGIAAHEAGHAIQHAQAYLPLLARSSLVPVVSIGSKMVPWIILGGILLQGLFGLRHVGIPIALIGGILYGVIAVMSLITLPVEIDASARAKKLLYQHDIVDRQELAGVNSVLSAAAWTYVVAALAAIGQLVYWLGRRK